MKRLSYKSRRIEMASSRKHYDVKLDATSLRQLIGWVDANCPYRGDHEVRAIPAPNFAGIEVLPIRPWTKTTPRIARPQPARGMGGEMEELGGEGVAACAQIVVRSVSEAKKLSRKSALRSRLRRAVPEGDGASCLTCAHQTDSLTRNRCW